MPAVIEALGGEQTLWWIALDLVVLTATSVAAIKIYLVVMSRRDLPDSRGRGSRAPSGASPLHDGADGESDPQPPRRSEAALAEIAELEAQWRLE